MVKQKPLPPNPPLKKAKRPPSPFDPEEDECRALFLIISGPFGQLLHFQTILSRLESRQMSRDVANILSSPHIFC